MAFYYYFNNGFTNIVPIDQSQTYYPQFTPSYENTLEISNGPFLPWTMPQNEPLTKNEPCFTLSTSIPVEEVHNSNSSSERQPPKKRRSEKTLQKEIISAKKNSESNLINQFYSFFGNPDKSERIVRRCCDLLGKTAEETEQILPLFYMAVRFINSKRGRKYVNAAMLLKFFTAEEFEAYVPEFKEKVDQCSSINLAELC